MNPERLGRQAGIALRRIRQNRGLRQSAVPARAGIPPARLSRYERGRQSLTFAVLVQQLAALDCSPEEFGRYFGPWGEVETMLRQQGAAPAAMAAAG